MSIITKTKYLAMTCVIGLVMALASMGYAQDHGDTGPAVASEVEVVVEAPVETPNIEAAKSVPAPIAEISKDTPTALSKLSSEVLNILVPVFLLLIGLLVTWILNWVRKKFKLDVTDQQIASWVSLADKAANRGAEWARNKAIELTEGKTVPGPEVLEVAVNWAIEMGIAFNLPEMGREKLIGLIESNLYARREDPHHPLPLAIAKVVSE